MSKIVQDKKSKYEKPKIQNLGTVVETTQNDIGDSGTVNLGKAGQSTPIWQ